VSDASASTGAAFLSVTADTEPAFATAFTLTLSGVPSASLVDDSELVSEVKTELAAELGVLPRRIRVVKGKKSSRAQQQRAQRSRRRVRSLSTAAAASPPDSSDATSPSDSQLMSVQLTVAIEPSSDASSGLATPTSLHAYLQSASLSQRAGTNYLRLIVAVGDSIELPLVTCPTTPPTQRVSCAEDGQVQLAEGVISELLTQAATVPTASRVAAPSAASSVDIADRVALWLVLAMSALIAGMLVFQLFFRRSVRQPRRSQVLAAGPAGQLKLVPLFQKVEAAGRGSLTFAPVDAASPGPVSPRMLGNADMPRRARISILPRDQQAQINSQVELAYVAHAVAEENTTGEQVQPQVVA
jgi:hypothetical protein